MTPLYAAQVIPFFLATTPDALLRRATEIISSAYAEAFDQSRALFSLRVAHDYIGHRRRAIIENALGSLPAFVPGVVASFVANATGGANHCELSIADVIVLTQSKIDTPYSAIQEARFRAVLADQADPGMFYSPEPPSESAIVWGSLVHGPGGPNDRTAGFIKVVFPNRDGVHLGVPSIDLYARYADLRPTYRDIPDTGIAALQAEPAPRLLPGVKPDEPTGSDEE